MAGSEWQQGRQRGEGSGGDEVSVEGRQGCGIGGMDRCGGAGNADRLAQEGCLAPVTLNEVGLDPGEEREDKTREAGSGTEIGDAAGALGNERHELGSVVDVPLLEALEVAW